MIGLQFSRANNGAGRLFTWRRIYFDGVGFGWTPLVLLSWRYVGAHGAALR